MRLFRRLWLIVALSAVLSTPLLSTACAAPQNLSTQGKIAFTADQVVIRITELENVAIQANAQGALPVPLTRTIVEFCVSANQTLKTSPNGWQATVSKAWAEAKGHLPVIANPAVSAAMSSVDVVLAALGGN